MSSFSHPKDIKLFVKNPDFDDQDENLSEDLLSEGVSVSSVNMSSKTNSNEKANPFQSSRVESKEGPNSFTFSDKHIKMWAKHSSFKHKRDEDLLSSQEEAQVDMEKVAAVENSLSCPKKMDISSPFNLAFPANSQKRTSDQTSKASLKQEISFLLRQAMRKRCNTDSPLVLGKGEDIILASEDVPEEGENTPKFGGELDNFSSWQ